MRKSNHTQSSEAQRKLEQTINNVKRHENWAKRWHKKKGYPPATTLFNKHTKSHAISKFWANVKANSHLSDYIKKRSHQLTLIVNNK